MYSCEGEVVYFVFLKDASAIKIAAVVLHRVGIFGCFCPKHGQVLRPSAAHLYPNIGRVPAREGNPLPNNPALNLQTIASGLFF